MIPQIRAYHPQFRVRNGSSEHVIEASVADWAPDDEVLRQLGVEFGCSTAGELVERLRDSVGPHKVTEGVGEHSQQVCSCGGRPCLKWDDKLVA
jgi:hypothetical protein